MLFLLSGGIIYTVFFILIPGIGAVTLRRRWKKFREFIYSFSTVNRLEYNNLEPGNPYSFSGKLESFKDDNTIWLKGETISLCINLNNQSIYSSVPGKLSYSKIKWSSVSSIVEGTNFYVFGYLEYNRGVPFLVGKEDEDLLVVINEDNDRIFETILKDGRDRNELWNGYTVYSFILGVLILIVLSYMAYKTNSNKTPSFFLLLAAGTPFYFFIPPGLLFYLKHRQYWDKSIRWSVLMDLKRLKGDYTSAEKMKVYSRSRERISLLYYLLGYLFNLGIFGIAIFNLFRFMIYGY